MGGAVLMALPPEVRAIVASLSGRWDEKSIKCKRCGMTVERESYGLFGHCSWGKLGSHDRIECVCDPCMQRIMQFIEDGA